MRDTDRWITPRVVVALIAAAVVVVLAALASVTYLAARGIDPAPTLKLAGGIATAAGTMLNLLLSLSQRRTTTKVERNTGQIKGALIDVASAVDERTRPATPPAVPPARHRYPETATTPGARGS
jgi:excinuclease UvrABC helicase subunit UvrB